MSMMNRTKLLGVIDAIEKGSVVVGDQMYCCINGIRVRQLRRDIEGLWNHADVRLMTAYNYVLSKCHVYTGTLRADQLTSAYGVRLPVSSDTNIKRINLAQLRKLREAVEITGTYVEPEELIEYVSRR